MLVERPMLSQASDNGLKLNMTSKKLEMEILIRTRSEKNLKKRAAEKGCRQKSIPKGDIRAI